MATPRKHPKRNTAEETKITKALLAAGISQTKIAKMLNKPKSTLHAEIHRNISPQDIEEWKDIEAEALTAFRVKFMQLLGNKDIKRMQATRGMTDYAIAMDKERLMLGGLTTPKPLIVINIQGQPQPSPLNTISIDPLTIEHTDQPPPDEAEP